MRNLASSLLPLALCVAVAPLTAQKMGSVNRNAPSITQKLEYPNGNTISVKYTSITFAQGKTMKAIKDPTQGPRYRQFVNRMAQQQPLGKMTTSVALNMGGKNVAAGNYALFFTVNDDLSWHLNLKNDDGETVKFKLATKAPKAKATRLCIMVTPGATNKECSLSIAFGNLSTNVEATTGAKKKAKPTSRRARRIR